MTKQEIIKELRRQNKAGRKFLGMPVSNIIYINNFRILLLKGYKLHIDSIELLIFNDRDVLIMSIFLENINDVGPYDAAMLQKIELKNYKINDFLKELI